MKDWLSIKIVGKIFNLFLSTTYTLTIFCSFNFNKKKLDTLYPYLQRNRAGYDGMRNFSLSYDQIPSLLFNPHPIKFKIPKSKEIKSNFGTIEKVRLPKNLGL